MQMTYYTTILVIVIWGIRIVIFGGLIYLAVLAVKGLRKYLNSTEVREEKNSVKKSLVEALKEHRTRCKMTQEFVAERLGVSRQAVSKWESGVSDPSTSNLFALAKLYEVSVEELIREVQ